MPLRLYLVSLGLEVQNISYYIFNQSWQLHGRLDKNSLMVNINCHFLEADLSQWAACPSMMRHWWRKPRKPIRGSHEPTRASPSSLAKCSSAQWHRKLDLHSHRSLRLWKNTASIQKTVTCEEGNAMSLLLPPHWCMRLRIPLAVWPSLISPSASFFLSSNPFAISFFSYLSPSLSVSLPPSIILPPLWFNSPMSSAPVSFWLSLFL